MPRHQVVSVDWDGDYADIRIRCVSLKGSEFSVHWVKIEDGPEIHCPFCGSKLRLVPIRSVDIEE